ncbi:DUF6282 family protein [Caldivirga maquilingensis]|uniref:Cytosolic protein n=1 Tax=Caldivirga maquilingensis (strain ATCC 700844 / DSM 13496 / JCM 10307 / IC-167) TaxID=397948 RepID=A8M903_CALMQ|nr:DUF6282 family protein [Caldivirga maquilingensis]ABW02222.1 conserved hypothetical protein [Caldivirga maquilingensis IC-167]
MVVTLEKVLRGSFDMHVHTGPDAVPRLLNDLEMAKLFKSNGFSGFIIKNHYTPTHDRAYLVNRIVDGVRVLGGIVLNEAVGGLNPRAVDIAGRLGALIVWFPTVDSLNEHRELSKWENHPHPPAWARMQLELRSRGLLGEGLTVLDSEGKIKPVVDEVLELIRQYDMVLATGHLSPIEGMELVKRAFEKGVRKVIITHPDFTTTRYTLEQQRELANHGAYLERTFENVLAKRVTVNDYVRMIVETGVEHNIISSDLGQVHNPPPTEGLREFVRQLIEGGLSPDDVEVMIKENPQKLT